jgi:hypothetical protein
MGGGRAAELASGRQRRWRADLRMNMNGVLVWSYGVGLRASATMYRRHRCVVGSARGWRLRLSRHHRRFSCRHCNRTEDDCARQEKIAVCWRRRGRGRRRRSEQSRFSPEVIELLSSFDFVLSLAPHLLLSCCARSLSLSLSPCRYVRPSFRAYIRPFVGLGCLGLGHHQLTDYC